MAAAVAVLVLLTAFCLVLPAAVGASKASQTAAASRKYQCLFLTLNNGAKLLTKYAAAKYK